MLGDLHEHFEAPCILPKLFEAVKWAFYFIIFCNSISGKSDISDCSRLLNNTRKYIIKSQKKKINNFSIWQIVFESKVEIILPKYFLANEVPNDDSILCRPHS